MHTPTFTATGHYKREARFAPIRLGIGKRTITTIIALLIAHLMFGQDLKTYQDKDTKLWGYQNVEKEIVIPANYTVARSFRKGVALVTDKDKRSYFINEQGAETAITKEQSKAYWSYFNSTLADDAFIAAIVKGMKSTRQEFDPVKRIEASKCKELALKPDPVNAHNPFVSHKKKGLTFLHPYTLFPRQEHKTYLFNTTIGRFDMPFKFKNIDGEEYGFGFVLPMWIDDYGTCSEVQHISILILNNGKVMICDKTQPYNDGLACNVFTCWNGKKQLEFHDLKNYNKAANYSIDSTGPQKLQVLKYERKLQLFINDELTFETDLISCALQYDYSPIPVFYNKGEIKFFTGKEEYLYKNKR